MTTYANYETKEAWIKYDFGNELARRWFGDEVIDALPKISRGKNKGKPKGVLEWTKCHSGGWVSGYGGGGGVMFPGIHKKKITIDNKTVFNDPRDLSKDHNGKMQSGWVGGGLQFDSAYLNRCQEVLHA